MCRVNTHTHTSRVLKIRRLCHGWFCCHFTLTFNLWIICMYRFRMMNKNGVCWMMPAPAGLWVTDRVSALSRFISFALGLMCVCVLFFDQICKLIEHFDRPGNELIGFWVISKSQPWWWCRGNRAAFSAPRNIVELKRRDVWAKTKIFSGIFRLKMEDVLDWTGLSLQCVCLLCERGVWCNTEALHACTHTS